MEKRGGARWLGGDVASLFKVAPHLGRGRSLEDAPGGERLRPSGYSPPCAKFAKKNIWRRARSRRRTAYYGTSYYTITYIISYYYSRLEYITL